MKFDLLRIEDVLREYVGAFAPIVIQDAVSLSRIDPRAPQAKDIPTFLAALKAALPADVDKQEVLERVRRIVGVY